MYFFCDFLIFSCLFVSGFHFGYYCKYTYIYRSLWLNWFVLFGVLLCLLLAVGWTLRKHKKRKYLFENFYIVFYGLICSVISAVFLITENTDISFYFIFMSMVVIYLPCYNYISLRCDSHGSRPARIALGNTIYFAGLTAGFSIFNDMEPKRCAWVLFGISLFAIVCVIINEVLQQYRIQDYKSSCDLVFNLMNEEKLIYAPRKSVLTLFVGRDEYYFKRNIQWMVVGMSVVVTVERCCLYSMTYLTLMYRSTIGYTQSNYLYLPYLLYVSGCALGSLLMLRYKPKLIYLMFGLIKITIATAILGVYDDNFPEHCFILLCFYYICMGVYSSIGIQMLLECSPFLYTELTLAGSYTLELTLMEISKLEIVNEDENEWTMLLVLSVTTIFLTICSICLIQLFLIDSVGLVEIRNRLLGIHRLPVKSYDNKLYKNNFFLQMEIPSNVSSVVLENNRVFQQYPAENDKNTKL
ncbi:uncharacterized protein LOC119607217 isoform X1 [Lucilia sericata]|uniref:uncharacterized protein LOC119607217 isoform X1 n=1 Tax=Lucilia sericata TaxID=13632 RepID=UPI0018A80AC2|nr:uncharacterized protein LOC119607217 isoform X1 [Lucilia sericata]